MRLDTLLMSVLVGLIMIAGGVLVINDQILNYEKYPGFDVDNTTFANTTNRIEHIQDESVKIKEALEGTVSIVDVFGFLLKSGKAAVQIVWNIFGIMTDTMGELTTLIGLPPIFGVVAVTAILIVMAFSIVYMFFRFQPR